MKEDYTHITFLLDRSGSMSNVWSDVKGGFKTIIEDQKKEAGKCTFSLIAFDDEYEVPIDFQDIQNVSGELNIEPRNWTALLDAIGKAINQTGERLAKMDEKDRPSKILMFVQSDGIENASKEFKKEQIAKMIKEQEEKYNWKFMFLGADMDSVNQAQSFGFSQNMSSTYNSMNSLTSNVSQKMSQLRGMNSQLYASCNAGAFTEEEREELNK